MCEKCLIHDKEVRGRKVVMGKEERDWIKLGVYGRNRQ